MILPLIYYGNPLLRKKALEIAEVTAEVHQLAADMIESMIHYNGVGLAAPQIGRLVRLFVIRDELVLPNGELSFASPEAILNPSFQEPSEETAFFSEGCLSIPGVHADVERPVRIRVRYQKLTGEFVEEEASGFRARVMMHENDHLNGVLYFDRLSPEARGRIEPALREVKKKYKK